MVGRNGRPDILWLFDLFGPWWLTKDQDVEPPGSLTRTKESRPILVSPLGAFVAGAVHNGIISCVGPLQEKIPTSE